MPRTDIRRLALSAIATSYLSLAAGSAFANSTVTVYASGEYLNSGDVREFEIFDENCNQSKGQIRLTKNQRVPITICVSSAGYGTIRYRNITNNGRWTGVGFLKNQDKFAPN